MALPALHITVQGDRARFSQSGGDCSVFKDSCPGGHLHLIRFILFPFYWGRNSHCFIGENLRQPGPKALWQNTITQMLFLLLDAFILLQILHIATTEILLKLRLHRSSAKLYNGSASLRVKAKVLHVTCTAGASFPSLPFLTSCCLPRFTEVLSQWLSNFFPRTVMSPILGNAACPFHVD